MDPHGAMPVRAGLMPRARDRLPQCAETGSGGRRFAVSKLGARAGIGPMSSVGVPRSISTDSVGSALGLAAVYNDLPRRMVAANDVKTFQQQLQTSQRTKRRRRRSRMRSILLSCDYHAEG